MDHQLIRLFCILGTAVSIFFTTGAHANQCPTTLTQNTKGFWVSTEKPGWGSPKPTATNVKIDESNFTGAAYNPAVKQIACIYKTSKDNKTLWVVLFSSKKHAFQQDDLINMNKWSYKKKYKFFVCGKPQQKNSISDCQFNVK